MSERLAFQERLLPRTTLEASKVPFYRRQWAGIDPATIASLSDLHRLPILTREAFASADDLMRTDIPAVTVIHSSGTTGKPLLRSRGSAELEAVALVARRLTAGKLSTPRVVFTTIGASVHGGGIPIPSNAHSIAIALTSSWLLQNAVSMILRRPILLGVEDVHVELHGRPRHLAMLARELSRHQQMDSGHIGFITSVGYPMSQSLKRYLKRVFPEAVIRETYSLSEVVGGGERCSFCEGYHLDAPVFGEIVGLDHENTSLDGTGRLVLTELFPFSQLQPLIRYDTGDLVRIVDGSCPQGMGFEYVGRKATTPVANLGGHLRVVMSPWSLSEMLEEMPGSARGPLGNQLTPPYDRLPMGPPYLDAQVVNLPEGQRLVIRVGVAFSPGLYPSYGASFQSEVMERLLRKDAYFRDAQTMKLDSRIVLCEPSDFPPSASLGK